MAEAYVTYGNVDRPEMLRRHLPAGTRFVDAEVVVIDGIRLGFAGGGMPALGLPGEVEEEKMAAKLAALGPIDVLCTHVPPALPSLSRDVVGGRQKGFRRGQGIIWSALLPPSTTSGTSTSLRPPTGGSAPRSA